MSSDFAQIAGAAKSAWITPATKFSPVCTSCGFSSLESRYPASTRVTAGSVFARARP